MSRKKSLMPDPSRSLLSPEAMTALIKQNPQAAHPNPMVRKCGFGPTGKTCRTCGHHLEKRFANVYHKCALMFPNQGAVTDIRVGWDACSRYEEATSCK